jgi:UDP-N-acetylglucosamine acyltransferase
VSGGGTDPAGTGAGGVDSRAVVSPQALIGPGTTIGPFSVIGPKVRLGRDCRIGAHVVIEGRTVIGDRCRFFPFASIGQVPQDLKYRGEDTSLTIGNDNVFRESVTINLGTAGGLGETVIRDRNFFMTGVHIAHDCRIGDGTIFANAATLAGHVDVEDGATLGAFSGVHQFCRVGREAFIGGYSVVTQDALPFCLTVGNRAEGHGPNLVGLRRRGYPEETIRALKRAYRILFRVGRRREDALPEVEAAYGAVPEVALLCRFIRESRRGVVG